MGGQTTLMGLDLLHPVHQESARASLVNIGVPDGTVGIEEMQSAIDEDSALAGICRASRDHPREIAERKEWNQRRSKETSEVNLAYDQKVTQLQVVSERRQRMRGGPAEKRERD